MNEWCTFHDQGFNPGFLCKCENTNPRVLVTFPRVLRAPFSPADFHCVAIGRGPDVNSLFTS